MGAITHVPNSLRGAGREVRISLAHPPENLPREQFVRTWSAIAYLFPGLHPDGYEDGDSGWPGVLKRFAAEAWRRAAAGKMSDEELYPGDAAWSGIFDRLLRHMPQETGRRLQLAANYGDILHA